MVSVILVVCSLCVFLSMCLFVLCVLCLTVLVNCLLNAFAICVCKVNVFSLKVMVLFLGCVFCLLVNPCIVFQRVCVIPVCVLVFPPYVRFVCLYERCEGIEGSLAFRALMLFLCSFFVLCVMGCCVCLRGE